MAAAKHPGTYPENSIGFNARCFLYTVKDGKKCYYQTDPLLFELYGNIAFRPVR